VHVKEVKDSISDLGGIVSMYILHAAQQGGEGTFASVAQIARQFAEQAPDLSHELVQPE